MLRPVWPGELRKEDRRHLVLFSKLPQPAGNRADLFPLIASVGMNQLRVIDHEQFDLAITLCLHSVEQQAVKLDSPGVGYKERQPSQRAQPAR